MAESILLIDTVEDLDQNISDSDSIVVQCFASWNPACKRVAPHYLESSKRFKANFVNIDVDEDELQDEALKYDMGDLPYFMVFKNGKLQDGSSITDQDTLLTFLEKHLEPDDSYTPPAPTSEYDETEVKKLLETALSEACESVRQTYKVDFDEQKALDLLAQTFLKLDSMEKSAKKIEAPKEPEYKSILPSVDTPEQWEKMIQNTKSGNSLVIDCWKPGCAPCKKIAPEFDKMQSEFEKATFAKVNVGDDDLLEFALTQGLEKIPFFIVYKDGVRVEETLQHSDASIVRDFITRNLKGKEEDMFSFDMDF